MEIIRTSPHNGKTNKMEIDVTPEQIFDWHQGMLIQKAMPLLSPEEKEFIMTGLTKEDWEEMSLEE